jgi:scyllo-inositol 2-dehydrogenase (NADP+)
VRYLVVGLGNIGQRRQALLGARCVATADPYNEAAAYRSVRDVPVDGFDAAVLAIPDDDKIELVSYLLEQGKHVLVEKPLPLPDQETTRRLEELARSRGLSLYTAYNHRFEPLLVAFKEQVGAGAIGEIYHGRLFYGNGTVRHVAGTWRDQGLGAIQDLGCHLLDLLAFVVLPPHPPTIMPTMGPPPLRGANIGCADIPTASPASGRGGDLTAGSPSLPQWGGGQGVGDTMHLVAARSIETKAPDRAVIVSADGRFVLEVMYHSWRNSFAFELYGSKGSIHCFGLRKWGGSELLVRKRVFPSGHPHETRLTDEGPDVTWEREIAHFEQRCAAGQTDLSTDWWIARTLRELEGQL